jgi:hypothetical protein
MHGKVITMLQEMFRIFTMVYGTPTVKEIGVGEPAFGL